MVAQQLFGEMTGRLQIALLVQGDDLLESVGRGYACHCGPFVTTLAAATFVFFTATAGAG
jgi:hypothetical protein